jgi:hypothetical protein
MEIAGYIRGRKVWPEVEMGVTYFSQLIGHEDELNSSHGDSRLNPREKVGFQAML